MILFWSEVICLALTWWFGFVISYVAITQIPEYNDPMRMGYVPYTMAWCFISGFLASGCSFPHLMVFDTSSDTILYLQTLREMQEDEAERENEELAGAFGTTGYLGLLQDIASSAMRCAIPWVHWGKMSLLCSSGTSFFFSPLDSTFFFKKHCNRLGETILTETALWLFSTHSFWFGTLIEAEKMWTSTAHCAVGSCETVR